MLGPPCRRTRRVVCVEIPRLVRKTEQQSLRAIELRGLTLQNIRAPRGQNYTSNALIVSCAQCYRQERTSGRVSLLTSPNNIRRHSTGIHSPVPQIQNTIPQHALKRDRPPTGWNRRTRRAESDGSRSSRAQPIVASVRSHAVFCPSGADSFIQRCRRAFALLDVPRYACAAMSLIESVVSRRSRAAFASAVPRSPE
jgi:hypothetical protein